MKYNESIQIERLKLQTGSYIEATITFCGNNSIEDFEDLLEILNPALVAKIRQEFIDKNFIPSLKKDTLLDFM